MIRKFKKASALWQEQGFSGVITAIRNRNKQPAPTIQPQPAPKKLPENWTDYMSWLTFANAGMLTRGNAFSLEHAIKNLPSTAPIIEIGSFCGLSTNLIGYLKERHRVPNRLLTSDKWEFEGAHAGGMLGDSQTVTHEEYRRFVKESFMRNVQLFSRNDVPYTIEAFSDEFFGAWKQAETRHDVFGREVQLGGPISLCYIDGNHTYDFAKRDFENTDRFLEQGGFILFDDSSDRGPFEGVCQVVAEVQKSGRYELVAKNPNYLFRKL